MKKIEVHDAEHFYWPKCEKETWVRLVTLTRPYADLVKESRDKICSHCGYRLTIQESFQICAGGACLPGYFFTCEQCGSDTFVPVVIYEEDHLLPEPRKCTERPPKQWGCHDCEKVYRLTFSA